jgi:hypothetical protein
LDKYGSFFIYLISTELIGEISRNILLKLLKNKKIKIISHQYFYKLNWNKFSNLVCKKIISNSVALAIPINYAKYIKIINKHKKLKNKNKKKINNK